MEGSRGWEEDRSSRASLYRTPVQYAPPCIRPTSNPVQYATHVPPCAGNSNWISPPLASSPKTDPPPSPSPSSSQFPSTTLSHCPHCHIVHTSKYHQFENFGPASGGKTVSFTTITLSTSSAVTTSSLPTLCLLSTALHLHQK